MGVPKQKHTKSRRNKRRMHIFIKAPNFNKCSKCGKPVLPHTVCFNCGYYKGMEVIDVLKKLTKKEKKQREKEIKGKPSSRSGASLRGREKEEKATEKKPLSWEGLSKG